MAGTSAYNYESTGQPQYPGIDRKEYEVSPEMSRQRHVSLPHTNQAARTAKYPTIVVETFPNLGQHLKNLKKEFADFHAMSRNSRILFVPRSGPEYHAVVKYLKSIEVTEPDWKYAINPLHVCIRGIPDFILIEDVQAAITERGYLVDQIKQITPNLCYVKVCGGKDNTKILEMRELFKFKVRVELWKSGPVKREIEHREPNESVTLTSRAATSGAPPATAPSLRPQYLPAQSTENQAVESEASSTAKYPAIVVESFPNLARHLKNIENEFGRMAYAEAYYEGIRFVPRDGPEYHAVIKYLKSIEATEPGLKYIVRSLDVCIHGLPSYISTDAVKNACTDRGYLVNYVKLISTNSRYRGGLHYLKISGRKDNTKILEMQDLLGYWIEVELWRGGPVKMEKKPIPSATSDTWAREAPGPAVPPLSWENLSVPAPQFGGTQAPAPAAPLRWPELAVLARETVANLATATTAPLLWPQQPILAEPSSGNQIQTASPIVGAITPEQLSALTAQITALTLTVFQIFGQHNDHNQ